MRKTDFSYELPDDLIASEPLPGRSDSRLLVVEADNFIDKLVSEIPELVSDKDLMVFNNTRVLNARMRAVKPSGGKVEILLERVLTDEAAPLFLAQMKSNKKLKVGTAVSLDNGAVLEIIAKQDDGFYELRCDRPLTDLLSESGEIPLPPYIKRAPTKQDQSRYQTVYAEKPGAVAAPTAGLHFDDSLLSRIKSTGVEFGFTTLHVGAGTFQPVRSDDIREHQMHKEYCTVDEHLVGQIEKTRERGGRVIAVGTTTVRALESASRNGRLAAFSGDTNIFIYPGYTFQVIDALMTNFHLPESTLIMLVAAFIGCERTMAAYRHAVAERYRFFSYGDAMWLASPQLPHG
ncbi:MAG: tRNA preQ1(34) S-adenosylmethionine ribosyltransferase-isomerase QueA [Gammaproteobacteria bacterium]